MTRVLSLYTLMNYFNWIAVYRAATIILPYERNNNSKTKESSFRWLPRFYFAQRQLEIDFFSSYSWPCATKANGCVRSMHDGNKISPLTHPLSIISFLLLYFQFCAHPVFIFKWRPMNSEMLTNLITIIKLVLYELKRILQSTANIDCK